MDDVGNVLLILVFAALVAAYLWWWLSALMEAYVAKEGLWVLMILVFQFFGPLAWYLSGPRPRSE